MNNPDIATMNPASAVATTGSDAAPLAHTKPQRPRINTGLIKETDITKRMRLLVHYMVFGADHPTLAAKIKRAKAVLDLETGKHVATELVPVAVGEPLTVEEAARLCNKRFRWARRLLEQPAIQNLLRRETAAFREGAKARAWRKIDQLAHTPGDGSAAWAKVNHQAAVTITGEPKSGTTVNVQTNVGFTQKAGVIWRIPDTAPQVPGEQAQIEGKAE